MSDKYDEAAAKLVATWYGVSQSQVPTHDRLTLTKRVAQAMREQAKELEAENDRLGAEVEGLSQKYRRLIWLNHGHIGLYGDDGEMQCGLCRADYKRDDLERLEALYEQALAERAAKLFGEEP